MTSAKEAALKQPTAKQPAPKQPAAKQTAPKQMAPKQGSPKQTAPKQTAPKQTAPKQTAPKQIALKQTAPRQPALKQPATRQHAAKPTAAKKPAPKQTAPKQTAPKQPALKQHAPKKALHSPPSMNTNKAMVRIFNPLDYMTKAELLNIDTQFAASLNGVDVVLFWTGVAFDHVQRWAKIWGLKTLTIAMGPLMDPADLNSPKAQKKQKAYSRYVKGASGRFAHYARQYCRVVVLTNPPPNIYSSREGNTYQQLEEPILKGLFGDTPVRRIDYLHPTVDGAAHVTYQAWPCNKIQEWAVPFGSRCIKKWKKLNWSYKSLVTTSKLNLNSLQNQALPVASILPAVLAQSSGQQDQMAVSCLSESVSLPGLNIDDRGLQHAVATVREILPPQRHVDIIEEVLPAAESGIQSHETRVPTPEITPGGLTSSDNDLQDAQSYDRLEQRGNLYDQGHSKQPTGPSTPVYTIKRCRMPELPVVPVFNIDSIAVGTEVTIDISEHDANKVFLYLTMKCEPGLQVWWRVKWDDTLEIGRE